MTRRDRASRSRESAAGMARLSLSGWSVLRVRIRAASGKSRRPPALPAVAPPAVPLLVLLLPLALAPLYPPVDADLDQEPQQHQSAAGPVEQDRPPGAPGDGVEPAEAVEQPQERVGHQQGAGQAGQDHHP